MSFLFGQTIETADGVYRPEPIWLEATVLVAVLILIAVALYVDKLSPLAAALYCTVLVVLATDRWLKYRKYGRLGQPSVAIAEGALVMARPGDTRGSLKVSLQGLNQLIVYGRSGRRTYRFVQHDGTFFEAVPNWGASVERAVVVYLQRVLSNKVTVKEPQTLFASVRGDVP